MISYCGPDNNCCCCCCHYYANVVVVVSSSTWKSLASSSLSLFHPPAVGVVSGRQHVAKRKNVRDVAVGMAVPCATTMGLPKTSSTAPLLFDLLFIRYFGPLLGALLVRCLWITREEGVVLFGWGGWVVNERMIVPFFRWRTAATILADCQPPKTIKNECGFFQNRMHLHRN